MRRSGVQFSFWALRNTVPGSGSWSCSSPAMPRPPERARQLSRTFHGTKREALRALAAPVTEVSAGKITSSMTTLRELLARWLDHVAYQLSPTTVREYRRFVSKMIEPALGKLTLRRVTTQRLDAYYASLSRERGAPSAAVTLEKSRQRMLTILSKRRRLGSLTSRRAPASTVSLMTTCCMHSDTTGERSRQLIPASRCSSDRPATLGRSKSGWSVTTRTSRSFMQCRHDPSS